MKFKNFLKKCAKFILKNDNSPIVQVNISQINYNNILDGKKILITGGSKGIGLAIAQKCIKEGAKVIITGRNEESLKKISDNLGKNAYYIKFDNENLNEIEDFWNKVEEIFDGEIDCLINNAGISLHEGNYKNVSIDGYNKQFDINLKAPYFLSKKFIEYKLSCKNVVGDIINISSETGSQCYDIPYGMTKAALNSFTKAMSRRVYKDGIRINAVAPGVTITDMTKDYVESKNNNLYASNSSNRYFLPEEIAEIVCFLLTDASKCISGEVIHCNASNHCNVFWDEDLI